ncbi:MAG TPA: FG-GAP-like repeat-containing protein, partial [Bacteroidales bacterium]|nr:FG-GAP-like repeat-containing protein [Bacteroidales bacterium]
KEGDKANYIEINLIGRGGNTMALGAKAELWSNGNYQYIEHFLSRGYASSVDPVIHFGLSGAETVDSIKVTWPLGKSVTILRNIKANQIITMDEKDATPVQPHINKPVKPLMFTAQDNIVDYVHRQKDYVDFSLKQRIIPHKFSQIGPVMAKGDINGDGLPDIIVGSTNELPTTVFLREGKKFKSASFEGLTTMKSCPEGDLAIVDIDNDGDNDVIAVSGGYQNNDDDYRDYVYKNSGGRFTQTVLPVPSFPSTVLRLCDYNKDGYTDIFIGSRVKRNMYPYSNKSWILSNNNGKFTADTTLRFDLGMVTDAVWTDYDGDGWEDLLVVREWNSPVILRNMEGKGFKPVSIQGFEDHHGLWYSVTAGDFDNDGDDDYIIGNLGDNNRFTVSDKYPLSLYVVDLDMDGTIDPVMTAYWTDKDGIMEEYPVNYLDELWSQSVYFKKKIPDYASFSYANINDIFDETVMKRVIAKLYANTTSSYVIWNDNGKFTWEKLPVPVQLSPLTHTTVQDLNGDGYKDVILTGNDYSFDVSTGYYDANKGLVLINKGGKREQGKPSFDLLEPPQSGLMIEGMVESLLYFKGDTSLVVAGVNRSGVKVFEHKSK